MAKTRAPRRWQIPSTRNSTPGRSATSTESRVTEEGATPGGRSSMGGPFSSPGCAQLIRRRPKDDRGPRWSSAGLANDDGDADAGGATRHERGGGGLHACDATGSDGELESADDPIEAVGDTGELQRARRDLLRGGARLLRGGGHLLGGGARLLGDRGDLGDVGLGALRVGRDLVDGGGDLADA